MESYKKATYLIKENDNLVTVKVKATEKDSERQGQEGKQQQHQPPNISPIKPLTREQKKRGNPPASEAQSADAPPGSDAKHQAPPSSGDRDIDITGQSYIQ